LTFGWEHYKRARMGEQRMSTATPDLGGSAMKTSLRKIIFVLAAVIGLGTMAIPASASGGAVLNHIWGGYTIGFGNPDPQNNPLAVSATWKVPAVASCSSVPIAGDVATWVGLGGINSNYLEQIGTDVKCASVTGPYYYAVYQLLPSQSSLTELSTSKYPVSAGDSMRADVVEQGAGTGGSQFVLQEWDTGSSAHPKNWYFDTILLGPGTGNSNVTPRTADWIVEDPVQLTGYQETFMKFSPAEVFQNCYWTQDNVRHELIQGRSLTEYTITTLTGTGKELTGPVATNGTQFQVTWEHN
jgi:Peptidase A4 family